MKKYCESTNSLPSYENPPVIEVACGIKFKKIKEFKAPHFGLFWDKLRKKFPSCQHAPTLGFPDPSETEPTFELPLPRIWFINKEKNGLIQLQENIFLYNWRKMQPEESYPRYDTVIKAFQNNLKMFTEFIEDEKLGSLEPIDCELTYINDIVKGEGWDTVADIHKVVPELDWRLNDSRFLPEPRNLGWKTIFALPEDKGRFIVKLDKVARKIDSQPMLRLEISARGLGVDKSLDAVWAWFEIAHEWIVRGFTDITSEEIQKSIWRRIK